MTARTKVIYTLVRVPGRLFSETYRNAVFTEHGDGDLTVESSDISRTDILAIYPKGHWSRVKKVIR
jgi:hypothetical protein